jgi:CzcA family heavy metal efflux pump
VEGRLLIPLGLAYIVALAASLIVAVTITPVLSALFLPKSQVVNRADETVVIRKMKAAYRPILDMTITRWRMVGITAALMLALSLLAMAFTGRSFLPSFNEGSLTVSAVTLPGTSLEQSDKLGNMVERRLLEQPEVIATSRRTGRAELDEHVQGVNASEIDVVLGMKDRSKEALLADIRQSLAGIPGLNINIGQPVSHRIDHMLSGTRSNIAVNIFGPDLYELRRIAEQVRATMENVSGVVDLSVEQQADIPVLTVDFRRDIIAQHGLTIRQVSEAVETALVGHEVSRILEGQASYDLVVRYPLSSREDLESVREVLLTTASGAQVPLHALADIRRDSGPNRISRQNVQRKITVMANVAEEDLVTVVDEIRRNVSQSVALPPAYRVEYGGQFESATSASRTLTIVGALVVLGIFILLFMAFGVLGDALLVMLNLPLALIGGVVGVLISDGVLSVASIVGFITLFGIATRNGVMMIAHIRHLLEDGEETDFRRAVERGAMERLVPVLMTTLTAGLALVPLALSAGDPGSEIQAPMAIVILFGLLSSTALNMVVVPAMYLRFGARHKPNKVGDFTRPAQEPGE